MRSSIRFVTYVVVAATRSASSVKALTMPPRSSETYRKSTASLISGCLFPAFLVSGMASGISVLLRSTRSAERDRMEEGSVGKERRGWEGNCMVSFPAVDATMAAAAVGDAWKNSTVRWDTFGFLMMIPAFWAAIWRARTYEWKK